LEEIEAFVVLRHVPFFGPIKIRHLVDSYGSAQAVLKNSQGKTLEAISLTLKSDSWKKDLEAVERKKICLISYKDPSYPSSLFQLSDFPPLLYVWGNLVPEDSCSIGIVGTRACSSYGYEMAKKIASELTFMGCCVVSGLARGIDTAAHIGALENGRTLAFIGSGLNDIYPKENLSLAKEIVKKGALISEYPMNTAPRSYHFPSRNRLISAFSKGLFLAEAPLKSGAMITVKQAISLQKPCFVLPGRADIESFQGNHDLLKKAQARLVENASEMISLLSYKDFYVPQKKIDDEKLLLGLTPEEKEIMKLFPAEEVHFETLVKEANMSISALSSLLMQLVMKKKVQTMPGKFYKKI